MRPSLFEFAGGEQALRTLAAAHHERCLANPELNHPFNPPDLNPQHVERLAAYWAEVFGGPPVYARRYSDQEALLRMHSGNGDVSDLARRFVDCFVAAADDAGLPSDPEFRAVLRAYMNWAVSDVLSYPEPDDVPRGARTPRWSWDGLQSPSRS